MCFAAVGALDEGAEASNEPCCCKLIPANVWAKSEGSRSLFLVVEADGEEEEEVEDEEVVEDEEARSTLRFCITCASLLSRASTLCLARSTALKCFSGAVKAVAPAAGVAVSVAARCGRDLLRLEDGVAPFEPGLRIRRRAPTKGVKLKALVATTLLSKSRPSILERKSKASLASSSPSLPSLFPSPLLIPRRLGGMDFFQVRLN